MSKSIVFETVGDANYPYPYICVYEQDQKEPFMEIAVNELRKLELTLYENKNKIVLNLQEWKIISETAQDFLSKVLSGIYD